MNQGDIVVDHYFKKIYFIICKTNEVNNLHQNEEFGQFRLYTVYDSKTKSIRDKFMYENVPVL